MFGDKYIYCKVKFDNERTYWYRTNVYGYRAGMKVVVPVTSNGFWKIATITEKLVYKTEEAPFPLTQTKGVMERYRYDQKANQSI